MNLSRMVHSFRNCGLESSGRLGHGLATVVYFASGVEATRQLAGGSWTSPRVVLPPPNQVSSFQSIDLAVDQSGNAIVGASIFDATINVDRASAWVAIE